jgi:transcriptional regulator with XRE-family HTH domain
MKALKQVRDRRGLSQRRLARQAGVSFRALQMIEAGQTDARLSSLMKIASEASWKLWLFEFVDTFRRCPREDLVAAPPDRDTRDRIRSLLASTVETLCAERGLPPPWWCGGVGVLAMPWFVAGVENLKALALLESPAHFRKRNIFVLANFLSRA